MPEDSTAQQANDNQRQEVELARANDTRLLTPILLMALIIAVGLLLYAVTGQTPPAS